MKFPKHVKHRGKALAVIYGKSRSYPQYRVAWSANGKRRMKAFDHYGGEDGALRYAEKLVPDLAKGSRVTALSPSQANDALAALQRLESYRQQTGRTVSMLRAVSEYAEAALKLDGASLSHAVDGYLTSVASVKRKDLSEAVEELIAADEPRTLAKDGQRAQLSAKYAYNRAIILRRFGGAFPNTAVSDLGKEHLETFIRSLEEFSAKSRNHHRAAIRQFVAWAVRKDYISSAHRLGDADGMRPELANNGEIEFYTPKEFRALLEAAEGPMQAMVAIGGLAGLRTAELLRLSWKDVWRVPGHVEVTSGKSKTRQRRLVEVNAALSAWLEPFRGLTGPICPQTESVWQKESVDLCELAKVTRKGNGLRHSYCTYHFAMHGNENATAQQAGNSPAMIHSHYKGLATKTEAEAWFAVAPQQADNVIQMAGTTSG